MALHKEPSESLLWILADIATKELANKNATTDRPNHPTDLEPNCPDCASDHDLYEDNPNGARVCKRCGRTESADPVHGNTPYDVGHDSHTPVDSLLPRCTTGTRLVGIRNRRLNTIHERMGMQYTERARYHTFMGLERIGQDMGLPKCIVDTAKQLYKELSERKLSRGLVRKGLIMCCVYHACIAGGVPRSFKELSTHSNLSVRAIVRANKLFVILMRDNDIVTLWVNEPVSGIHLVSRCCMNIQHRLTQDIENAVIRESKAILRSMGEDGGDNALQIKLKGRSPVAVAAGVVGYTCAKHHAPVTKTNIATLLGVTVVTMNKVINTLVNHFKQV